MSQIKFYNTNRLAGVAVTNAASIIADGSLSPTNPRTIIEIPLHNLSGTLYLRTVNRGATISDADIQIYGVQFTSSDKVAQILVSEGEALWGYATSANTLYPSERW